MVAYDKSTLVIRHLPSELSTFEKINLVKYFGATQVKCLGSDFKKSSFVFAKFNKEEEAEIALKNLHQTNVLGQLLSVEYARNSKSFDSIETDVQREEGESGGKSDVTIQKKMMENFQKKLNSWCNALDFNLPPPTHLKYAYPPPTLQVLKNICQALSKVPKFYTQVLHLMNKMNLPCPFVEDYIIENPELQFIGDLLPQEEPEESEIESELEDEGTNQLDKFSQVRELKRPKPKRPKRLLTIPAKRPKLDRPSSQAVRPEEVFETSMTSVRKPIELVLPTELTARTAESSKVETEVIGVTDTLETPGQTVKQADETIVCDSEIKPEEDLGRIITEEELAMNRVPSKDYHLLPVFKNYQPGLPSCRLYIKNLAKNVQISDLNFIYKRYFIDQQDEQGTMFDIRLMQEGRMKGQAFVTLQNILQAQKALTETNGFLLKGKAMVVQFARSSKAVQ